MLDQFAAKMEEIMAEAPETVNDEALKLVRENYNAMITDLRKHSSELQQLNKDKMLGKYEKEVEEQAKILNMKTAEVTKMKKQRNEEENKLKVAEKPISDLEKVATEMAENLKNMQENYDKNLKKFEERKAELENEENDLKKQHENLQNMSIHLGEFWELIFPPVVLNSQHPPKTSKQDNFELLKSAMLKSWTSLSEKGWRFPFKNTIF
uniref:Uncharacterized protein n=1 Tax=Ditylenchus dipsaci TaxID=166011 RepID=A0A915ECZ9_9BILA